MSAPHQQSEYIESKVLTASPHKLHLALIDGAIRYGRQAEAEMQRGDFAAASEPLMRTIDVVGELLAGVRQSELELSQRFADLYFFLFRTVSIAKVNDDVDKLAEALKLLDYERQTWQMVCEKLESDPDVQAAHQSGIKPPHMPLAGGDTGSLPAMPDVGFSLEA